jgi:hypothetical protein
MSLITINNYEAYLLDYVEGNLLPEQVAELMLFLEKNPTLKDELEDFETHELKPLASESLFDKSSLKKVGGFITLDNYEHYIIAEIEGVNSLGNSAALQVFLDENPQLKGNLLAYQNTKLVGESILFGDKRALKKKSGVVIFMNWASSSAAAIIIVLLSLNWFSKKEPIYTPLSNKIEYKTEGNNFEEDVLASFIIREDVKTEEKALAKPKQNKNRIKIEDDIELNNGIQNENHMANLPIEQAIDSENKIEKEQHKEIIVIEEELLVAENNVTITYEAEILDDGTPNPVKQKITKLDLIRAAVKHKINGNLDKGKEKVLFAINSKPLNFLRKNKK